MWLAAGLTAALALAAWMIGSQFRANGGGQDPAAEQRAAFEEATGVRLVRVAVTAGGGLIDLRYQVLDPDKALSVHDKDKPPTVINEATGQIANQSWMPHHSGSKRLHTAVTYYDLLNNPKKIIARGKPVTVVIGGTRLEHVIVE